MLIPLFSTKIDFQLKLSCIFNFIILSVYKIAKGALMKKSERAVRNAALITLEIFSLITVFWCIKIERPDYIPQALLGMALLLLPMLFEKVFSCKICLPLYLCTLVYVLGPTLGDCYGLYYTVNWWDKLLHTAGGVLFALLGIFICQKFIGTDKKHLIMTAVFALCLSVTLSAIWEFIEFGMDAAFGSDMQHDTLIQTIDSYLLGDSVGVRGTINGIDEVIINGEKLSTNGYIDIGLIDTMTDMMLETLGALAVSVGYIIDRGKHQLIVSK